jgi:hypothetical protein
MRRAAQRTTADRLRDVEAQLDEINRQISKLCGILLGAARTVEEEDRERERDREREAAMVAGRGLLHRVK